MITVMKKTLMALSLSAALLTGFTGFVSAQEQPKPQKDTVNMDTDAKPTQYYATEDEKSGPATKAGKSQTGTIIIIAAAFLVVAGAAFFLLKKKK
jgi:LPXTG-motif cell wall-anchored protein